MKAQALATQDHGETAGEILKKIVEECEMKATNAITTLNNWLSQGWVRKTPGKVLGALAVGGLIMTAAVVTPSSAFADEPSRPLSVEASQGYGSIHDMAQAALLNTNLDTWLQNYGMDSVEDSPARATYWELGTRLYTEMDFVEDSPVVDRYDRGLFDGEFSVVAPTIVDRYDRGLFDSEFSVVAPTIVDRYDRGLFDSEFSVVAPTIVDRYDRGLFDSTVAPTIVDRYDRGLFDSEFNVVTPTIVDRYDRGLFDGTVAPTIVDRYNVSLTDDF